MKNYHFKLYMYTAEEARKEYESTSKLTDVQLYLRNNEEEFNSIGESIKKLAYLGKNTYQFFRTFYIRNFENESKLYKKVLENFGYKVEYIKPRNEEDLNNDLFHFIQYIISISW